MKSTQPLPLSDGISSPGTHPLSLLWKRSRPALLLFAGGAVAAFAVSGVMNRAITTQSPPLSLPVANSTTLPERLSLQQWRRENPNDASFIERSGDESSGAPVSPSGEAPSIETSILPVTATAPGTSSIRSAAAEVADSNASGTAWKGFVSRSEDDRRRLRERREEDRLLRERRVLEAEKKRVERELEVKSLQEKYRAENKQALDAQHDEDKRRIQARVDEDHKAVDDRERGTQQLAQAPVPSAVASPSAQP